MSKFTAEEVEVMAALMAQTVDAPLAVDGMMADLARRIRQESAARHLFEVGHTISPFMTLDNGPDGCCLRMQFASLADGQAMHTALVRFFKEPQP